MVEEIVGFGAALANWRKRRRISQLDLARRVDTTQRHISFLESGRSAPGRDMARRLATGIGLDLRQRNALLASAGYVADYPETPLSSPDLAYVRAALQIIIDGHGVIPAIAVQHPGIGIAANDAMGLLIDGIAGHLLEPPVNVHRLALHPNGMARRIDNFPAWAAHVIRAADERASRHGDPQLFELADELRTYLPPAARPDLLAGTVAPMVLRTRHGRAELMTTRMTFANPIDATLLDIEIEAFIPADQASMRVLNDYARDTAGAKRSAALRSLNTLEPTTAALQAAGR